MVSSPFHRERSLDRAEGNVIPYTKSFSIAALHRFATAGATNLRVYKLTGLLQYAEGAAIVRAFRMRRA